ncbi:MAG: UDP-galactopyranose mutase [Anaerolineaceae bacterium]|nr:UDP-galactopyranose mutase [Anaerolineaceae bacterium]
MYDYLIVGAGLYGSVFAHEAKKRGKSCLVIDKRPHIGGNCYTERIEDIEIHVYGAHIFHTSDKDIWDYVNQFARFNRFINSPIAKYHDRIFNLPLNMNTFNELWGTVTPEQAKQKIKEQTEKYKDIKPTNLEEQVLYLVGEDIYEVLIKSYTEKQWGRKCYELPPFIIQRLPIRFTYNNNYYDDSYQGIPINGYTDMIKNILVGIEVRLNTNFFEEYKNFRKYANKLVWTGMIDEYYSYKFGRLQYRSLRFQTEKLNIDNFQGNAVVNYTDSYTPFTRIIEHKHFNFVEQETTVITREYPLEWNYGEEPYYPINDEKNNLIYNEIEKQAKKDTDVIFGGRLGNYKYYDMDKVIRKSLDDAKKELGK